MDINMVAVALSLLAILLVYVGLVINSVRQYERGYDDGLRCGLMVSKHIDEIYGLTCPDGSDTLDIHGGENNAEKSESE